MKYIKTFERVWSKNLVEGKIYEIQTKILAYYKWKTNMNLGRITKLKYDKNIEDVLYIENIEDVLYIEVKTFLKDSLEEIQITLFPKDIKKVATPEQIIEFETLENQKKYNL